MIGDMDRLSYDQLIACPLPIIRITPSLLHFFPHTQACTLSVAENLSY